MSQQVSKVYNYSRIIYLGYISCNPSYVVAEDAAQDFRLFTSINRIFTLNYVSGLYRWLNFYLLILGKDARRALKYQSLDVIGEGSAVLMTCLPKLFKSHNPTIKFPC